ncbi:MAG: glycoside hydrolase family 3 C-terminal domain-containing protein [Lachnospiraceae bacterium]
MERANNIYSGTLSNQRTEREIAHGKLARKLAAEGIVLLKNDGLLPLKAAEPVALFGGGAGHTITRGIGSGDVNNRESITIYQGLKAVCASVTSKSWFLDYQERYIKARALWKEKILKDAEGMDNPFDAYAKNPFSLPDGRNITKEDIKGASVAVYVISRIAGEGKDRRLAEGDYYLSIREREDILYLCQENIPVVLIINSGAPVEIAGILQEAANIKAVLYISLPGQEGGNAVADMLYGKVVPGGRLTSTWAASYKDYPCAASYGYLNGNLEKEEYREGIYVGYRYFTSFNIKPLFPFGYGLSYTSFEIKFEDIKITGTNINVCVSVKNTGDCYSGREVVQVYITPPQTGIYKEYQKLAGFAKTGVLKPGDMQKLSITIRQKQLASFSEEIDSWITENGKYGVWTGSNANSLELVALLDVKETVLLGHTSKICTKTKIFQELTASEYAINRNKEWLETAEKQNIPVYGFKPQKEEIKISGMPPAAEGKTEELIPLLHGGITEGASMLGSSGIHVPGSAGETAGITDGTSGRKRYLVMADGPAGLRLQQSYETDKTTGKIYNTGVLGSLENGFLQEKIHHDNTDTFYQYCTSFPAGTLLAQTWDTKLLEEFGMAVAKEMEEFNTGLWLAPGMNIQRNPLCGRNFEYFSEDPLLSGVMAAAVTNGVQNGGKCGVTIKHFACNNQEDNRMGIDACISVRALREIYLRGFEIAVKESKPAVIMTSYNLINGVHAAENKDLCTTVARNEWGFKGVFISDWNTTVPEDGSVPWKCIAAGNDIIMPGNTADSENLHKAYKDGKLAEEDIRSCAGRVTALIKKYGTLY